MRRKRVVSATEFARSKICPHVDSLPVREPTNQNMKVGERRTPDMFSWPMLLGGLVGNVIPRQATMVVVRDEEVIVSEGEGKKGIEEEEEQSWAN